MIKFERYGKKFFIPQAHWENFRERFNPDNAKRDKDYGMYRIERSCTLCEDYYNCERCPFRKMETGERGGCVTFLDRMFKGRAFSTTYTDRVEWSRRNNPNAMKQLKRLQKLMDEIEARQE